MDLRQDMRSYSCDLCGQGYTNRKDFDEHNDLEHGSRAMTAGEPNDQPLTVSQVVAAPIEPSRQEAEKTSEEPKAEEPEAEEEQPPTADREGEQAAAEDEQQRVEAKDEGQGPQAKAG